MVIGCTVGACGAGAAIIASVTGSVGTAAALRQAKRTKRRRSRRKSQRGGGKSLQGRLTKHQKLQSNLSTSMKGRKQKKKEARNQLFETNENYCR